MSTFDHELSHGQACDWRTDTQTDAGNNNKKKASGKNCDKL